MSRVEPPLRVGSSFRQDYFRQTGYPPIRNSAPRIFTRIPDRRITIRLKFKARCARYRELRFKGPICIRSLLEYPLPRIQTRQTGTRTIRLRQAINGTTSEATARSNCPSVQTNCCLATALELWRESSSAGRPASFTTTALEFRSALPQGICSMGWVFRMSFPCRMDRFL